MVPLEKATAASCGAKAAACAQLALAASKAGFSTPAGVCLPFGSMEAAIKVCSFVNSECVRSLCIATEQ